MDAIREPCHCGMVIESRQEPFERAEIDQNRQSLQTRFTFWGEFLPCAAEVKIRKLFFEIAS